MSVLKNGLICEKGLFWGQQGQMAREKYILGM